MPETRPPQIDDPLLARLDRLAQRQRSMPPRAGAAPPPPPPPPPPSRLTVPPTSGPAVRTKRRHPARSARIGALAVSCATTGGLSFLFATSGTSAAGAGGTTIQTVAPAGSASTATTATTATTAAPATTAATATTATAATTATTPTTAIPTTVAAASAQPVSFDGSVVNTRYGPVQVQIQVTNGALTDVAVVQYPDADRKSVRINEQALPTLRSEALTAQSAQVHTVSGATYTSDGYAQSLQSAIDAAAAAGVTVNA